MKIRRILWIMGWIFGLSGAMGAEKNATLVTGPSQSVRLAVVNVVNPEMADLRQQLDAALDLATVALSSAPDFELVERTSIRRILQEQALVLSQTVKTETAVRIGKLLSTDWLLLAGLVRISGTNHILARMVDAQTGMVRDMHLAILAPGDLAANARQLTQFAQSSHTLARTSGQRLFLSIGVFNDLSVYNRFPDFSDQLRTMLTSTLADTRVAILERAAVEPMLNELQLSMGGFMGRMATGSAAQPAFYIIDGIYQSYRDTNSKVNLILRIQQPGEEMQTFSFNEVPGLHLNTNVLAIIRRVIMEAKSDTAAHSLSENRKREALEQVRRGLELSRLSPRGYGFGELSLPGKGNPEKAKRLRDGIEAFRAALLLDPACLQAKYYLGLCLVEPAIGEKEEARGLLREVITVSTNELQRRISQNRIARSYEGENDSYALELYRPLLKYAKSYEGDEPGLVKLKDIALRLYKEGKLTQKDIVDLADDCWRTRCRIAEMTGEQNHYIPGYSIFETPLHDYYRIYQDKTLNRQHQELVLQQMQKEFPRLKPYIMTGGIKALGTNAPPWLIGQYFKFLDDCEQDPSQFFSPRNLVEWVLLTHLDMHYTRKEYELVIRLVRLIDQFGGELLPTRDRDRLNVMLGNIHATRAEWQEAIACYERLEGREIRFAQTGPWGTDPIFNPDRAIGACRRAMNGETNAAPSNFKLAHPFYTLRPMIVNEDSNGFGYASYSFTFELDGKNIWLGNSRFLGVLDTESGKAQAVYLTVSNRAVITSIVTTREHVWVGTQTNGVIRYDKTTRKSQHYGHPEGLSCMNVSHLFAARDRIWVGFGQEVSSLGYIDLKTGKYVGMDAALNPDFKDLTHRPKSVPLYATNGPPRGVVKCFWTDNQDFVWVGLMTGLYRYSMARQNWNADFSQASGHPTALAGNSGYVLCGCSESTGRGGLGILDRRTGQWQTITRNEQLPANYVRSVAIDDRKAWVAGFHWVAVIDPKTRTVERFATMPEDFKRRITRIQLDDQYAWVAAGLQLYRVRKY